MTYTPSYSPEYCLEAFNDANHPMHTAIVESCTETMANDEHIYSNARLRQMISFGQIKIASHVKAEGR